MDKLKQKQITHWLEESRLNAKKDDEHYLTKIPIFGYFFRKIKKNRQAIERALKKEKETKSKVKKRRFLGILRVTSSKRFNVLKKKR